MRPILVASKKVHIINSHTISTVLFIQCPPPNVKLHLQMRIVNEKFNSFSNVDNNIPY